MGVPRQALTGRHEVPGVFGPRSAAAQPFGKRGAELLAPVSDAFVGDHDAPFGRDQLDITQAEAENMIQPNGMPGELGREAMTVIGVGLWCHPVSFAYPTTSRS
jgi:hypothetical protein